MCCCGGLWSVIKAWCPVIGAISLVADMVTDCLTVWDYHNKAYEKNGHISNILRIRFYKKWTNETGVLEYTGVPESYYFIISFSAMVLPMVIATICLLLYLLYVDFMKIRQFNRSCNADCGKVFGTIASSLMAPLAFILCVILSIVVIFLSWIVTPLLHIFFAFFIAFGNNPAGNDESKMKSLTWKKFAAVMMFLSIVETFFEAVPQAIVGVYISAYQPAEDLVSRLIHLWETNPFQVVSLFFSFFSVVKTLGTIAYTTTNDWDNSIFGMVNFLKNQAKKDFKREKDEEIEMIE